MMLCCTIRGTHQQHVLLRGGEVALPWHFVEDKARGGGLASCVKLDTYLVAVCQLFLCGLCLNCWWGDGLCREMCRCKLVPATLYVWLLHVQVEDASPQQGRSSCSSSALALDAAGAD
jgi:hypothetical protein